MNIVFRNSPNRDKNKKPIDRIIIHWFGTGTLESADKRFMNPKNFVSAHYGISGGTIYQWVKEEEVAYHAGVYSMNQRSIGIEHDATTTHPLTSESYDTSGKLVALVAERWNIPLDRTHIIKHSEVKPTQCCGTIDIDKIISLAQKELVKRKEIIQEITDLGLKPDKLLTENTYKVLGYKLLT
ncbi:MAG: peptidoglycan recognition family protein [Nanoarchaeota archaeon]